MESIDSATDVSRQDPDHDVLIHVEATSAGAADHYPPLSALPLSMGSFNGAA